MTGLEITVYANTETHLGLRQPLRSLGVYTNPRAKNTQNVTEQQCYKI